VCSGTVGTLPLVARSSPRLLDVVGTVVRLGLAAVWLFSGGIKAADPAQTYVSVAAYRVLPPDLVGVVAAGLPFLELALGVLLLVGVGTRLVGVVSALLLLVFIAGIVQAWARGLSIDCGCFGGGGDIAPEETRYPQELARDLGFLALAVWLVVRPWTAVSLDGWLGAGRRRSEPDQVSPEAEPVSHEVQEGH